MSEMHVGRLSVDAPDLEDLISRVANIEGEFRLEADGESLYAEIHFPVVELARQLAQWSASESSPGSDFEYDSMFFEEPGIIWIRQADQDWRIGSIEQHRPDPHESSWSEIREVIRRFVDEVVHAGKRDLGLDLAPTITEG